MLVSYNNTVLIYEDYSDPTIYRILYQSDPTQYYHNVSMSYPEPAQIDSSTGLLASYANNIIFNLGHA